MIADMEAERAREARIRERAEKIAALLREIEEDGAPMGGVLFADVQLVGCRVARISGRWGVR
jgi:hypothetical protein